jgi:cellulose synthase/poly-beta-1,6-N-acetylglucosamine synthase-like glycosyltransferase
VTGDRLLVSIAVVALILFDLQNVAAWWKGRVLKEWVVGDDDYTILIPVFGSRRFFEDRSAVESLKQHILVCVEVTPPEMAAFADELEQEGWRVFRGRVSGVCTPRLLWGALHARGVVNTTYVIRLDADSCTTGEIAKYVAAMRRDGADICSCKVHVAHPTTQAQKFQALEYRMAMLSRHFRPMLTSGACYFAKTDALRAILDRHSFWFAGEDVETGRIARALRMRVRHLDLEVLTEAPATWRALLRQRRLWWAGNFRHSIVNFDKNLVHMPSWAVYYGLLVWAGLFFKWYSLATFPDARTAGLSLLALWGLYAAITFVSNLQVATWRMLIFPPYALFQCLLMPIVGIVLYPVFCIRAGGFGRYRFGYRRRARQPISSEAQGAITELQRAEQERVRCILDRSIPRTAWVQPTL